MNFKGLSILHEWMNKNPLNSNFIQLCIFSSASIWKTTLHGHSFHTKIKLFYSLGTQYESEKWKWSRSVASDSVDCNLPGSSVHGIFQTRILELPFPSLGLFLTRGSNLGLPHCRQKLYHLSYQGSPEHSITGSYYTAHNSILPTNKYI